MQQENKEKYKVRKYKNNKSIEKSVLNKKETYKNKEKNIQRIQKIQNIIK